MPKGGARTRSGPPPDPNALTSKDGWTVLPTSGRPGRAPAWPLHPGPTARERQVWNRVWKKPQALLWELRGQEDLVGLYVRRFVEAEQRDTKVTLSTLVRQLADELLLTNGALLRERIKIGTPSAKTAAAQATPTSGRPTAKDRLTLVAGGGGG